MCLQAEQYVYLCLELNSTFNRVLSLKKHVFP